MCNHLDRNIKATKYRFDFSFARKFTAPRLSEPFQDIRQMPGVDLFRHVIVISKIAHAKRIRFINTGANRSANTNLLQTRRATFNPSFPRKRESSGPHGPPLSRG